MTDSFPGADLEGVAVLVYTDEDSSTGIYTTIHQYDCERRELLTVYGTRIPVETIVFIERVAIKTLSPIPLFEDDLEVLYRRPDDWPCSSQPVLHHVVPRGHTHTEDCGCD